MYRAHRLTEGAPAHRMFNDGDFLRLLGRLEWSDLTRGFGPRLGLFLGLDGVVHLSRRRDVERICLPNERSSLLRNRKSRRVGWSNDRGVPLVRVEVLGWDHEIILIPLQVVHQPVLGYNAARGRGGTRTVAQSVVKVNGDDTSLRV